MNPKLTVLYKEMPWLSVIADEIGNPSVVKVKRLDAQSITRWTGLSVTCDDSYWIQGYLFGASGNLIAPVAPTKQKGFTAFLRRCAESSAFAMNGGRKNYITVEDALKQRAAKDEVRYVVLFGHHLDDYMELSLYVYKMPQGVTTSELLSSIEQMRAEEAAQKLHNATSELKQELTEVQ